MSSIKKNLLWIILLFATGLIAVNCSRTPAPTGRVETPSLTRYSGNWTEIPEANFGKEGTDLQMFLYRPVDMPSNAPVVVALHGCGQTATAYRDETQWNELADRYKFYVIYPQTTAMTSDIKCFNWYVEGDITRGSGEAKAVINMLNYVKGNYSVDDSRVFVTGLSAGGGSAAVLLATYPDVFSAGAIMSGIPYRCAPPATTSACMNGSVDNTPATWGDRVRAAYSSYTGPYPKVSIWQGTSDYTVNKNNAPELVDQWTDVHGLSQTPTVSTTIKNYPYKAYKDTSGNTLVEYYEITGMGHGIAVDPGTGEDQGGTTNTWSIDKDIWSSYYAAQFFGLMGSPENPTVYITYPTNNMAVSDTVLITADATDNNAVTQVKFYIDTTLVATDTTAPYSYEWNTGSYPDGAYTIKVVAYDADSNTGEKLISVTVANTSGGSVDGYANAKDASQDPNQTISDVLNLTGPYAITLTGNHFLTGSAQPYTTKVNTTGTVTIPTGATVKHAFLYYAGSIALAGYDGKQGDWTTDNLNNASDVATNGITFSVNSTNYGPYDPSNRKPEATHGPAERIGSKSTLGHVTHYEFGTFTGVSEAYYQNRLDITGIMAGKSGTVNLTVNYPEKIDESANTSSTNGGNPAGSTLYNSCFPKGHWSVLVIYEKSDLPTKQIILKDGVVRAWDYTFFHKGYWERPKVTFQHLPTTTTGLKYYAYASGARSNASLPTSPTCSCGCGGGFALVPKPTAPNPNNWPTNSGLGGDTEAFWSNTLEDPLDARNDPMHRDKSNGPWALMGVGSMYGGDARVGNDWTKIQSGSKITEFPNLYEGESLSANGVTPITNENWPTILKPTTGNSFGYTSAEVYDGRPWAGRGTVTYYGTGKDVSVLSVELASANVTQNATETTIWLKADQKDVFKPQARVNLLYMALELTVGDSVAPSVSLTSPSATVTAFPFDMTASASDNVGVKKVEFYIGTTKVGEDSTAPYEISVANYANGTYTFKAVATDNAGNTAESTSSITINYADTSAPVVNITAPSNASTVRGTVTITAEALDNIAVSKVEFYVDNVKIGEDTTEPYTYAWNTTGLQNFSTHSLKAIAYDSSNNTVTDNDTSVTVDNSDNVAPTVNVTAPSNGGSYSPGALVSITASASDNVAVSKVQFYINNILVSEDLSSPYEMPWDTTGLSDGSYAIKAIAFDTTGNTATDNDTSVSLTSNWMETFSASGPDQSGWSGDGTMSSTNRTTGGGQSLYLEAANSNATTTTKAHQISVTLGATPTLTYYRQLSMSVPNTSASSNFRVLINGTAVDSKVHQSYTAYNESTWTERASISLSAYANSTVTLKFEAKVVNNIYMNAYSKVWVDDITITNGGGGGGDTTAPSVNITAPANSATVEGTISVTASASDNVGVTKVEFYLNNTKVGEDTSAPYEYSWNTTASANGTYAIKAIAYDAASNTATDNDTSVTVSNNSGSSCTDYTATAGAHVTAGRAVYKYLLGYGYAYYAVGSNDFVAYFSYTSATVKETATGYYNSGSCD